MASTRAAKHDKHIVFHENEELVEVKANTTGHEHQSKIKQGHTRLDRRSAQGVSGNPKKSGKGGQFTWNGPIDEASVDAPMALDKNDPNYVDEDEEELASAEADDKKAK